LIGSYGIADRDPKRGDINFLSIEPLVSFAIAISPPFHDFGGSFESPDAGLPSEGILDHN
jgi:hypothetical protein